ncbi:hypothetical protein RJ639_021968 [Escallonia herrerae]|uniref:Retrotransposon Copia-like N-terminal domain-containing protein n=1 Tax=Escallonia herrerae TaxID=1293975 RepID=A0AA88V3X5_9ASTE|nr:hypothetical protein RJ639_021968 [Escallonia herrerae]
METVARVVREGPTGKIGSSGNSSVGSSGTSALGGSGTSALGSSGNSCLGIQRNVKSSPPLANKRSLQSTKLIRVLILSSHHLTQIMATNTTFVNSDNTASNTTILQFNPASQLPIKLAGSHNFTTWKAQLVQNAIQASVEPTLASTVAIAPSAHKAWTSLHTAFANKSQTQIISLQDQLARITKDSRPVTDYLLDIRSIADELATAGAAITNVQLIVRILQGLIKSRIQGHLCSHPIA